MCPLLVGEFQELAQSFACLSMATKHSTAVPFTASTGRVLPCPPENQKVDKHLYQKVDNQVEFQNAKFN